MYPPSLACFRLNLVRVAPRLPEGAKIERRRLRPNRVRRRAFHRHRLPLHRLPLHRHHHQLSILVPTLVLWRPVPLPQPLSSCVLSHCRVESRRGQPAARRRSAGGGGQWRVSADGGWPAGRLQPLLPLLITVCNVCPAEAVLHDGGSRHARLRLHLRLRLGRHLRLHLVSPRAGRPRLWLTGGPRLSLRARVLQHRARARHDCRLIALHQRIRLIHLQLAGYRYVLVCVLCFTSAGAEFDDYINVFILDVDIGGDDTV